MERIKKALERARQERAQLQNQPRAVAAPQAAAAEKTAPAITANDDAALAVTASGSAAPAASARVQPLPEPRTGRRSVVQETPLTRIQYTYTQVVDVPGSVLARNRIVAGQLPVTPQADAYKMLRARVLQRLRRNDWNVVGITSPAPGVGKTVTAVNLALSIAMEVDKTVLLVDADLRQPKVHEYFGQPASRGLTDYLSEGVPLADVLFHPKIGRSVILPAGRPVANSSELLTSPRMLELVAELKSRYPERIVVFDLPPVLAGDDAMAFAPHLDATLLVIEEGVTRQDELVRSVELLEEASLIGTVLNKARDSMNEYGYY